MTNEELEQKVKRLEEQLTEVRIELLERKADKKPYEVEVPEDIGDYYVLDGYGKVYSLEGFSMNYTRCQYERGLAFKTREEAEQFKKEQILLFKLHKWAEEHNEGWTFHENNTFNFYVIYKNSDKKLDVSWCSSIQSFTKLPYFKSREIAEQFIEEFRNEIIEVLC